MSPSAAPSSPAPPPADAPLAPAPPPAGEDLDLEEDIAPNLGGEDQMQDA